MTATALRTHGHLATEAPADPRHSRGEMILRVPLLWKLLGANAVLVLAVLVVHLAVPATPTELELLVLLSASMAITMVLVRLALRPLLALERTAEEVSRGTFSARTAPSPLADTAMARLTATFNRLLDRVEADRARMQYLAGRGARARDIERETVARELRESYAQTITGIGYDLAALQADCGSATVAARLDTSRHTLRHVADEMRSVAETLYPGALEELGLINAVRALARRVERRSALVVTVEAGSRNPPITGQARGALYRAADEALRNVEQHAGASRVTIRLTITNDVELSVEDDGRGMDLRAHDPLHNGVGLFSARAVLALAGGGLQIASGPGLGTRVTAHVPLVSRDAGHLESHA